MHNRVGAPGVGLAIQCGAYVYDVHSVRTPLTVQVYGYLLSDGWGSCLCPGKLHERSSLATHVMKCTSCFCISMCNAT